MASQFFTNYTDVTFLEKIRVNLRRCSSFCFSVSFIKKAGLVLLIKDIEAALERGCQGRLITSTYQNFTDIESLKSFLHLSERFSNFQCHLDFECFHDNGYATLGFHAKGYLFEYDDTCELVVGSSNITRYALKKNIEWDVSIAESRNDMLFSSAMAEFDELWNATLPLTMEIINEYTEHLHYSIERWDMDYDVASVSVKPNFMQRKALKELNRYRAIGTNKALIVSSPGSGKSYLSAFDALNFSSRRLLYVVHEGSILRRSLETFQTVFGGSVSYGVYDGTSKEFDADFVFSTNQTMARNLELFARDEFDYVIIDECHHATAATYKKILDYFQPEFLLGLTATPERMDNQDVFEMFDQNVPYELRLRDAIINDLIVPFKYFGIRDQLVNYGLNKNEERKLIAQMATSEHCDFIAAQIEAHKPQGKLKALAFCRNITHARMMCEAMGERYQTAYLTGQNNVGERIRAYNDLQSDSADLEILFTVDILNEGVDIPAVNMVLFLRPTESSTIFTQQLGRGLRKYPNKQYVTVLDFIGNSYKRSVQIAFALSGLAENFVMEKRLIASLVKDDFKALGLLEYGVEINVDDLSKEQILEYIDSENFNALKYLKQDYFNFKKYINAEFYPRHMDYLNVDGAPEILRLLSSKVGGKKCGSYYGFLKGIEEEGLPIFAKEQEALIVRASSYLPLVRPHEFLIMRELLDGTRSVATVSQSLEQKIVGYEQKQLMHALEYLSCVTNEDGLLSFAADMDDQLKEYMSDLLEYGLTRFASELGGEQDFKLWHSYRMDQVQLKLLKNPGYTAVGTYYNDDGSVVIFASLKKDLNEADKLNYKDKFLQPALFQWESMANLPSGHLAKLKNSTHAYVFIRKVADEYGVTLPFTYVGKGHLENPRDTQNGNGTWLFDIHMENELPDYLQYDFGLTA